jgi:hypothetical protein
MSRSDPGWGHLTGALDIAAESPAPEAAAAVGDRTLMTDRVHRYGWASDERRADLLLDCFTEDATWEARIRTGSAIGPFAGRDAIVAFV